MHVPAEIQAKIVAQGDNCRFFCTWIDRLRGIILLHKNLVCSLLIKLWLEEVSHVLSLHGAVADTHGVIIWINGTYTFHL